MWNKELRMVGILSFVLLATSSVVAQTQEPPLAVNDTQPPAKDKPAAKDEGPPLLKTYALKGGDAKKLATAMEATYKSSPTLLKITAVGDKQIMVYATPKSHEEILEKLKDVLVLVANDANALAEALAAEWKRNFDAQKAALSSLEEAMAKALKQNPDILVGIAHVREAEAELNRVRQGVMAKIVSVRAEIEATQAILEEATTKFERLRDQRIRAPKTVTDEELGVAVATMSKYKADLLVKKAALLPLLGTAGKEIPGSYKDALTIALKHNADILVAESKLRLAEAELNGRQQKVLAKIESTYADMHAVVAIYREAEQKQARLMQMRAKKVGVVTDEELGAANATVMKYKADLAKAQATVALLIGMEPMAPDLKPYPAVYYKAAVSYVPNANKLREALEMPVKIQFADTPLEMGLKALFTSVQDKGGGVNLLLSPAIKEAKLSLKEIALSEPVSLAAALQLIEDMSLVRFVIRDYGILGMRPQDVPSGARLVSDFVKQGREKSAEPQKK